MLLLGGVLCQVQAKGAAAADVLMSISAAAAAAAAADCIFG
jgi:hypothetical protein